MDNQQIFFNIFSIHNQLPGLTPFMVTVTKYFHYASFFLGTLIALKGGSREKKAWVFMVIGLISVYPLIWLIRFFIQEPRPFFTFHLTPLISPPTDLSFPSGHSSFMSVVASAFILTRSKWAWLFIPLAFLVGFSRIYVGVHYPLDVLGGFILGFVVVYLIKLIGRRFFGQSLQS